MKRAFYYLECGDHEKLFYYLDRQVDEGYFNYFIRQGDGLIIIYDIDVDEDDDIFKYILSMDLIEDFDFMDLDDIDMGYDDFYNNDDMEDN